VGPDYFCFPQGNCPDSLNLVPTKIFQTLSLSDISFELLFQLISAVEPNNNDYLLVKKTK